MTHDFSVCNCNSINPIMAVFNISLACVLWNHLDFSIFIYMVLDNSLLFP